MEPSGAVVRTKIVATVGPACRHRLDELVREGVDVFRINMAHGSRSEHDEIIDTVREIAARRDVPVAILVDLAGPKIRLGELYQDPLTLRQGQRVRLVRGLAPKRPDELTSTYEGLLDDIARGDRLLLADGSVPLRVVELEADAAILEAEQDSVLRSRQGIGAPGVRLSISTLTEADRRHAEWAVERGVEYISLSFVRSADDMHALRSLVGESGGRCHLIAKIEKHEALTQLEAIAEASDGVMVARGDLGIEIDVAETPVVQKRIIGICRRLGRPVIVATEMLDSMRHAVRPTRAEVSDVANAVLDGADACMLSGETAIGDYPLEAVQTMNRIMRSTERLVVDARPPDGPGCLSDVKPVTAAVLEGTGIIASRVFARLIVVLTRSGATARWMSRQRHPVPVIGMSHDPAVVRRMALYWGVEPRTSPETDDEVAFRQDVIEWARREGRVESGDCVVFVTGTGVVSEAHNAVFVQEVS